MTLQEIYDLAVQMGIKSDARGKDGIKRYLDQVKKSYEELSAKKKELFDKESLKNPYSDTRILFGDPKTNVKRLLAGIDADTGEMLLADRLSEKGTKIDLVISHHPSGESLAALHEVMDVQIDIFEQQGVPANIAHALFEERKSHVQRRFAPLNHGQAVDSARLLNIPLMVIHTVWDNLGHEFLEATLSKKPFHTAGDVLDEINDIPEFKEATRGKNGPMLVSGSSNRRAGKIAVGFTGGTSPSKELYKELARAGAGTIVEMHVPEEALLELRKLHVNVIDCGHMAADSIGANIFLDELEKRGVEVIPHSGLIRVKRKGK